MSTTTKNNKCALVLDLQVTIQIFTQHILLYFSLSFMFIDNTV